MEIRVRDDTNIRDIWLEIDDEFRNSRIEMEIRYLRNGHGLSLHKIRLKEGKQYCGSHPNACDIPGGRKGYYLEGLDWVEFNDRLNDALDKLSVNADVKSSVCILRKGLNRRIRYDSHATGLPLQPYEWNKDEDVSGYENYCNRIAPSSEYPLGTPGEYERKIDESA